MDALLAEYFASLKELTADYTGYRFLPGHYGEFTEIREETDRIISEYETRCTQLRLALAESRRPMTLLELDQALYVQRMQTYRYSYLFSYLNTWPKLFFRSRLQLTLDNSGKLFLRYQPVFQDHHAASEAYYGNLFYPAVYGCVERFPDSVVSVKQEQNVPDDHGSLSVLWKE